MVERLEISRSAILNLNVSDLVSRVNGDYAGRLQKRKGEHYRFLAWLSRQYNDALFYDLGTRYGISAMCLAISDTNRVISYENDPTWPVIYPFDFSGLDVEFKMQDATEILPSEFSEAEVILIDLDHTGETERRIISTIEDSEFSGIVILDDINYHKFPRMKALWESICYPKHIIPYAHNTGTGVVSYGPEVELVK